GVRRVPVLRRPSRLLGRARGRPEATGVPPLRGRLVLSAHEVPVLRKRAQPGPAASRAGEPGSRLPDHRLPRLRRLPEGARPPCSLERPVGPRRGLAIAPPRPHRAAAPLPAARPRPHCSGSPHLNPPPNIGQLTFPL